MSAKTTGGTDRPTPPRTVAPPPTETPRFTSGPWFVEDIDGSGDLSICYDERHRNPAAGFPSMLGFCFNDDEIGGGIRYDEARANAHLWAAAPTLYAECDQTVSDVQGIANLTDDPHIIAICEQIAARHLAALTAARGTSGEPQ